MIGQKVWLIRNNKVDTMTIKTIFCRGDGVIYYTDCEVPVSSSSYNSRHLEGIIDDSFTESELFATKQALKNLIKALK